MEEIIRGRSNEVIGRLIKSNGETSVYGDRGQYLGYANQNGTFDVSGRLVSNSESPTLLLR